MFGGMRLFLAFVVAAAHLHYGLPRAFGIMWAVPAAVVFYVLSGYAMTALVRNFYNQPRSVPSFYLDRFLRIAPQYYLLLLVVPLWWYFSSMPLEFFLSVKMTAGRFLENLAIFPLNFFMYNDAWRYSFVPTAWMLGAELQFYLLIPFLLQYRLRLPAFLVAIVVLMLAHWGSLGAFSVGMFPGSDIFGYRLLPGVLVYFLLGSFLYDIRNRSAACNWGFVLGVGVIAGLWWAILHLHGTLGQDYIRGNLVGLAGGLILVAGFARLKRRRPDEILGHLSYGVYLNHYFVIWAVLPLFFPDPSPSNAGMTVVRILVLLACSVVLAWIGWRLLDNPIMHWRRRRRKRVEVAESHPLPG